MCFWKTTEETAILIASYQGNILSTRFMTFHVKLDHLAEVVFVRFSHCKVTLFYHFILYGLSTEENAILKTFPDTSQISKWENYLMLESAEIFLP